jgi:hypothetical protein
MTEHPESRPHRAIGDVSYTYISQSSRGQVDSSAWSSPPGTSGRHTALVGAGGVVVAVGIMWLLAASDASRFIGGLLVILGVAISAVGVIGYRRERVAQRAMAERIDREQEGPVA